MPLQNLLKRISIPPTLLLVLIISLPLALPFLHSGLLAVGDGTAHLFRQLNYHQAILDGQIPPRWAPRAAHGLGAPIFLYNWFLPYSAIEILLLSGVNLVDSVRIFNIFCLIAAPLGMYFWLKRLSSPWTGVAGAILYAWAPYRLMSVYLYGAWGETLAMTLTPFLGLSLTNLAQKQSRRNILSSTLLVSGIITAHNLSAIFYLPLVFLVTLVWKPSRPAFWRITLCSFLGIALTAFFWLPSALSASQIQYDFRALYQSAVYEYGHFPNFLSDLYHTLFQLASPSAKVWYKDFSLGLPLLFVPLISALVLSLKQKIANRNLLILSLLIGTASYFLTLRESVFIWEKTPLKIFTYSYRLLAPATIFLSLAAAMTFNNLPKKISLPVIIITGLLSVMAGRLYLTPATGYLNVDENYTRQSERSLHPPGTGFIMGTMEFLPKTASSEFVGSLDASTPNDLPKIPPDSSGFEIELKENTTDLISFDYRSSTPQSVTINTLFFPNWQASIGKLPLPLNYDSVGRIILSLPSSPETSAVLIKWINTPLENLGMALSLASLLIFAVYLGYQSRSSNLQ